MKLNNKILGACLFGVLATLFYYMAGGFSDKIPMERTSEKVDLARYSTLTLQPTTQTIEREFPGVIVAKQKANISARLTAKVVETLVDIGDTVTQGDVLLRLDSGDLDAKVIQTEQALSSAQAQLNNARKAFSRTQDLVKKKLVSQSQFDQAESNLKTAKANFNQAQAAVTEAETTYGFSIITAPFDGVVTAKPVNVGDTATPGSLLLSIYNPQTLEVEANISESVIPNVTLGMSTHVSFPTYNVVADAVVSEFTPAADSGSRSYLVKFDFTSSASLFPGTYAKVVVEIGEEEILKVPQEALYQVGQLDYIKVINDDRLETRLVQIGENGRVRKGLAAGDNIVLNPQL